jgi:uncharacterized protein
MTINELKTMKKSELLLIAKKIGLKGFSRLTKLELINSILDFVAKGDDTLEKKLKKLFQTAQSHPPQKTRKTRIIPTKKENSKSSGEIEQKEKTPEEKAPKEKAPKKEKTSTAKTINKTLQKLRSKRKPGDKSSTKGAVNPIDTIDSEAQAREKIESLRYTESPLFNRGQMVTPEQLRDIDKDLPELSMGYGDGAIHLMPRDPKWLFCYWDITEQQRIEKGKNNSGLLYLRLHDVTHVVFNGYNSWSIHQFALNEESRWWYLPVPSNGRHFIAEIGYLFNDGAWNSLGYSVTIVPPPGESSPWVHDVFVTLPFDKPLPAPSEQEISGWIGDTLPSIETHPSIPGWGTPVSPESYKISHNELSIHGIDSPTSHGAYGVSSFVTITEQNKVLSEFPFILDADLRVFGATLPTAKLLIDGKPGELSKEGTFNISLAFPDGKQSHTFTAVSDKGEKKSITITFSRDTFK